MAKEIKVTLIHSPIGRSQRQKDTVKALGLTKLHQTVMHQDTPSIRGMLKKINHLIQIEEADA